MPAKLSWHGCGDPIYELPYLIPIKKMLMKLKIFIAVAAIAFYPSCSSTKYRATDTEILPVATQKAFDEQYPNSTNIIWSSYDPNRVILNDWELAGWDTIDRNDYEVRFDLDDKKHYAWYDENGNWIGTVYIVNDFSTLPAFVKRTIIKEYPSFIISSVNREIYRDRTAYEVLLKNADVRTVLLIDPGGTILKYKMKPL